MKRKTIAALLAPVLLFFLNACATASGAAQCNGEDTRSYLGDPSIRRASDGGCRLSIPCCKNGTIT